MKQKIIRVGNSLAITIPSSFAQNAGFAAGDIVSVEPHASTQSLVITTAKRASTFSVDPDFADWMKEIENKYTPAIKALAKA